MITESEIMELLDQWGPGLREGYYQAQEQVGTDLVAVIDMSVGQSLFIPREDALSASRAGKLPLGAAGEEHLAQPARDAGGGLPLGVMETALWLVLVGAGSGVVVTRGVFVWPSPGGEA